jgi:hypothetical protein
VLLRADHFFLVRLHGVLFAAERRSVDSLSSEEARDLLTQARTHLVAKRRVLGGLDLPLSGGTSTLAGTFSTLSFFSAMPQLLLFADPNW